jgi:hypothetical protein
MCANVLPKSRPNFMAHHQAPKSRCLFELHGDLGHTSLLKHEAVTVPESHMKTKLYLELLKDQAHGGLASHSREFAG